jgi:hypothetical protein
MGQTILADEKERGWRRHIDTWQRSGQSQRTYCERNGLALSTFHLWRRRLCGTTRHSIVSPPVSIERVDHGDQALEFILLPPSGPASIAEPDIVLVLGDGRYRLELSSAVQGETLQTVVRALEGLR